MKPPNKYLALIVPLMLSACAAGEDFIPPVPPEVQSYTLTPMAVALSAGDDEATQQMRIGQSVSSEWWGFFHAQPIDDMMKDAIAHSPSLESAEAALAAAQEIVKQSRGDYYPQIDASSKYQRQQIGSTSPTTNLYAVGATASFSPDVFGATYRAVERSESLAELKRYQLGAAYLTLTGNVVTQSITLASLRSQLAANKEIVADDEKNLVLVRNKFEAGKVAQADILAAESQLSGDKAQIVPIKQQISVAQHALAVLTGRFAGAWEPAEFDLTVLTLPVDLPVSLPSNIVHQRPDILAAEAQLHADSAAIGVAEAQMYPSLNLSAAITTQSLTTGGLFTGPSLIWNLASGIAAPLFHGGALEAQKEGAVDTFKASAAVYRQTVLQAFGQVADTLRALEHDAEFLQAEKQSLNAAKASLDLQRISYAAGKSDVLQLITAERGYQQARLGYIRAQAQRYQDTAEFFVAMGGGGLSVLK